MLQSLGLQRFTLGCFKTSDQYRRPNASHCSISSCRASKNSMPCKASIGPTCTHLRLPSPLAVITAGMLLQQTLIPGEAMAEPSSLWGFPTELGPPDVKASHVQSITYVPSCMLLRYLLHPRSESLLPRLLP